MYKLIGLCLALSLAGCSSYDPISVKECNKVVSHTKKLLKSHAPPKAEMMKSCKEATDQERGCAMAATKAAQLMQC